jgi:hypothetical protein
MLSGQSPLAISIGKARNGNYANARGIITTVTRTKANTPPSLARFGLRSRILESVHTLFGSNSIRAGQHLDESMSLILIDNTCLDSTETSKYASDLTFRPASTAYK